MTSTRSRSFALLALALALAVPHAIAFEAFEPARGAVTTAVQHGDTVVAADAGAAGLAPELAAPHATRLAALPRTGHVYATPAGDALRSLILKSPLKEDPVHALDARAEVPLLPGGEVTVRAERGFGRSIADVTLAALGEDVRANAGQRDAASTSDGSLLGAGGPATGSSEREPAAGAGRLGPPPAEPLPTPPLPRPAHAPVPAADAEAGTVHVESARVAEARAIGNALRVVRAAVAAGAALALPALAAWALYHRVTGAALLKHPARRAIMKHLERAPGAGLADLAGAASVTYTTAAYHVQRLVDAGHVVTTRANGSIRCYPNGMLDARTRALHEILDHPVARRVLAFLEAHPGSHRAAVARATGLSVTGVAWYLKRFEAAGLVTRRPDGRRMLLFVDADLVAKARARVTALAASLRGGRARADA